MKFNFLGFGVFACALLVQSGSSYAGNSSGGGGEFITSETNPWFIGNDPVRYCLSIDPSGFSAPYDIASNVTKLVLKELTNTFDALHPLPTTPDLLDRKPRNLTLKFIEEPCTNKTELVFRFGEYSKVIKNLLEGHARYTIGFSHQLAFNEQTGRAKGFIWLTPDQGKHLYQGPKHSSDFWSNEATLHNVLLHELGHIFGLEHASYGFMRSDVPNRTVSDAKIARASTDGLLLQRWQYFSGLANRPYCGVLSSDDKAKLIELLDIGGSDNLEICLEPLASDYLRLIIMGHDQKKELFSYHQPSWEGTPIVGVRGSYRFAQSQEGFPFPGEHFFLSAKNFDHSGRLEFPSATGVKEMTVQIQTLDREIRFTYFDSNENKFHYIGLLFPAL